MHSKAVQRFIDSPGFGVRRQAIEDLDQFADAVLALNESYDLSPSQPGVMPSQDGEAGSWESLRAEAELRQLHQDSVLDCVRPGGFGVFTSGQQVRGFRPHRFRRVPDAAERWRVQSVELVSLLLHDDPVVYVSPRLPAMKELREMSTRPPDAFEASGLESLRRGEDLVVGKTAGRVRMLGAIRSARQCLRCHGGERGDLPGGVLLFTEAG